MSLSLGSSQLFHVSCLDAWVLPCLALDDFWCCCGFFLACLGIISWLKTNTSLSSTYFAHKSQSHNITARAAQKRREHVKVKYVCVVEVDVNMYARILSVCDDCNENHTPLFPIMMQWAVAKNDNYAMVAAQSLTNAVTYFSLQFDRKIMVNSQKDD